MEEKDKEQIKKMINVAIKKVTDFSSRKLGDTPTDDFQLTPKGYVNQNGVVASRPIGSIAGVGQKYFATDTKIPMTFTGTQWVDGVGSVVAIN